MVLDFKKIIFDVLNEPYLGLLYTVYTKSVSDIINRFNLLFICWEQQFVTISKDLVGSKEKCVSEKKIRMMTKLKFVFSPQHKYSGIVY